ncbi:MAG: bis(5'-nucleosyl)-tetraphosphatase [Pseudomonadota bacterium]
MPQTAQYSAGVVVVRRRGDDWRYLLLRAYRNWDFPKGLVEAGETPLEAAIREVREETGLVDLRFGWGEDYRETAPYGKGKVARYYLAESGAGEARLPVSPELGRPEHHEFRWAGYEEARRILPQRLQPVLEWAHTWLDEPETARRV